MTNVQKQYREKLVKSDREIYHNARVRLFPRVGVNKITYCSRPIFREPGWENMDGYKNRLEFERAKMGESTSDDSLRRAKSRVFEYAMLNEFVWFVTLTLDKERINRYDPKEVAEKMQNWLRNKVDRNSLRYILVPELHKDGAVHAHGFMTGDLKMVKSLRPNGKVRLDLAGRTVWNITDWKYGWSTAVRIDGDPQKAAYYITKYIKKADKMVFGNFYYAGGHGLVRVPESLLFDTEFEEVGAEKHTRTIGDDKDLSFKYEDKGSK